MFTLNRAFIVNLGDMLERWSNCIFKYSKLKFYLHILLNFGFTSHNLYFAIFFSFFPLYLRSTLHRVLGNGQERYSVGFFSFASLSVFACVFLKVLSTLCVASYFSQIALFVEPGHDCLVECLPTCKSEKNPPK